MITYIYIYIHKCTLRYTIWHLSSDVGDHAERKQSIHSNNVITSNIHNGSSDGD